MLNGKSSDWKDVTSGVGAVLGPVLFIMYIYINGMQDMLKKFCECLMMKQSLII